MHSVISTRSPGNLVFSCGNPNLKKCQYDKSNKFLKSAVSNSDVELNYNKNQENTINQQESHIDG